MKYILIETFFGYLHRPILLWNLGDILIIALEIGTVGLWVSSVRDFIRRRKTVGRLYKNKITNRYRKS